MESSGAQDYQPRTVGNLFFVDSSMEYICHLFGVQRVPSTRNFSFFILFPLRFLDMWTQQRVKIFLKSEVRWKPPSPVFIICKNK